MIILRKRFKEGHNIMNTKTKEEPLIPLPNEIPPPLMPEIAKQKDVSQAVEMAVTQNTDLMNRLSLALKRTANLESRLEFVERDNHQKKEKMSVLDDELHILRSSQEQAHLHLKDTSNQLAESEKKYTNLYQTYTQTQQHLQKTQKRLRLFERFKNRVVTSVKKYIQKLKSKQKENQDQIQSLQNEVFEQKNQIESYQKQFENLNNQTQEAQTQYYMDLTSLVDYHEQRYVGLQKLSKTLDKQNKSQNQKIEDLENEKSKTRQQFLKAQKQLLLLEQKLQSSQDEAEKKLKKTLNTLNICRKQLQEKDLQIVDLQAKTSDFKSMQTEIEDMRGERDRLQIRLKSKDMEYQETKEALLEAEKSKQKIAAQNNLLNDQIEGFKNILEEELNDKTNEDPVSAENKQIKVIEKLL